MHTIIQPTSSASRLRSRVEAPVSAGLFRKPPYDCQNLTDAVKLAVYLPGVEASGVEITTRGPDLTVTARKTQFVRVNFSALHLENAQRNYQLCLRLGHGFDYAGLQAEIANGVLTILLPKKTASLPAAPLRARGAA